MPERRQEPRYLVADQVVVTVRESSDASLKGKTLSCSTFDLSGHGLRLQLDEPLEVGAILALWLKRLDGPGTVALEGEVKWSAPADNTGSWVGVALGAPSAQQKNAWDEMLSRFADEG